MSILKDSAKETSAWALKLFLKILFLLAILGIFCGIGALIKHFVAPDTSFTITPKGIEIKTKPSKLSSPKKDLTEISDVIELLKKKKEDATK